MPTKTKRCPRCVTVKPASEFRTQKGRADGLHSICNPCDRARQRREYARRKAAAAQSSTTTDDFEIVVDEDTVPFGEPSRVHYYELPDWATSPIGTVGTSATPPPIADPVAVAYAERDKDRAKRDIKREHGALLEENERLKAQHAAFLKLGAPEILVYDKKVSERSDSTACAVLSDWHVDEPVVKGVVHGLNEFSPDIAKERARHCFRNLLSLTDMMARDTDIKTIWIGFLGDFISGWIHEELLANTAMAPGDAMHFVEGLLASGVDFLLKESSYRIEADMIPGNHGRMTKQVHLGDPTGTSLETFMYRALANRYIDNPRVNLRVSGQAMVYRHFYETFKMRLIHGYEVKYGGGVGGITIPLRKALAQWNNPIRADLTVLGHFHQLFDGGDFIVNGSLIGYNTFAQAIKASYEEPRQAFFLVHARNGGQKSITAPIWLDAAHKRKSETKQSRPEMDWTLSAEEMKP